MKRSTTPRSSAAIYRKAARLVERNETDRSCYAVVLAQGKNEGACFSDPLAKRYVAAMLDGDYNTASHDWPHPFAHPDNRDVRVLLLGFMAAMVEAGDA